MKAWPDGIRFHLGRRFTEGGDSMDSFLSFEGQDVIVTGGATGMGEASARLFAERGASVAILDINGEGAENVAADIREGGGDAQAFQVDLTDWNTTRSAVEAAYNRHGRIDVLAHVAGGFPEFVGLLDCPLETWDPMVASNLKSMFILLKAVAPYMIEARYGRIVCFSSLAARSAVNPNPPHYTAAKAGVLGLARQVAGELGPHGITVNAIAPANVATPSTMAIRKPERIRHIEEVTPIGRLCQPEEVAAAVIFLCSREAGYITGVTLDVNGGAAMI